MSRIPNFAQVAFAETPAPQAAAAATPWLTPEGIAVAGSYDAAAVQGLDGLDT